MLVLVVDVVEGPVGSGTFSNVYSGDVRGTAGDHTVAIKALKMPMRYTRVRLLMAYRAAASAPIPRSAAIFP